MLFTQIEFGVFFGTILLALVYLKNNTLRKTLILAASYYFYSYWDYRFLSLILISTSVDYLIGMKLGQTNCLSQRRRLLLCSLVINLGILFFFKYCNFFITSFQAALGSLNLNLSTLNIILPVGISFYTFQTLSYTIDVYNRKMEPCTHFLDFAVFVAFFPQLVAGPIVRASYFLPQLQLFHPFTKENIHLGTRIFVVGMFKKVFVADRLAMFVDPVISNVNAFDGTTVWLAMLAYSIQIYCDFSGYSDMAIGISRILGYDLNINFDFPYVAKSIGDFWRRWHISLSTWIRDYLYIPLGGNRLGQMRTYVNTFIAMSLCGLWHGAGWTFVFWGVWHGLALIVNRFWDRIKPVPLEAGFVSVLVSFLSWATTMMVVVVGWVFFRAIDFAHATTILEKMFTFGAGVSWMHPFVLFVLFGTFLIHILYDFKLTRLHLLPINAWYTPAIVLCFVWLVILFYPKGFQPFIYFQF